MFYEFPADLTLAETRDIVIRHNEALGVDAFIEAHRGDFTVFNYIVSFDGSFPDLTGDPVRDREIAIIRELRGLTFDNETGKVASRKFHKFFNVGQREETQAHKIDWTQPHVILVKEDGSMITPYLRRDGSIVWQTKMGDTDVAIPVNEFVSRNPHYEKFARHMIKHGWTPLFEWCSRKQKIVIDYPEDKLVLLAVRDNHSGHYRDYPTLMEHGRDYGFPVVDFIEGSVTDPAVFLETVRVLKDAEGYIVRFHNGHMVKVKAEEYLQLHSMVDTLQREKNVLELILSEHLDDAKAFMSDDSRERVEKYAEAVERGMLENGARIEKLAHELWAAAGQDQKTFAVEYVAKADVLDDRERGMLFRIAKGDSGFKQVRLLVEKNYGTGTKVDSIRYLLGGVKWDDFRDQSIVIED